MITILLCLALARAGEVPEAPTQALAALGIDAPTPSSNGGWRAALPGGGIVLVLTADDEDAARANFEGMRRTAQSGVWPATAPEGLAVDDVLGDDHASILLRRGTTVVYVRDLGNDARGWVEKLLPLF